MLWLSHWDNFLSFHFKIKTIYYEARVRLFKSLLFSLVSFSPIGIHVLVILIADKYVVVIFDDDV